MKYFTKIAFFGFGKKEEPVAPKPFKTYEQTIESLPTYSLKKRLTKLQGSAEAYGGGTMPDNIRAEFDSKLQPIINELKARGELTKQGSSEESTWYQRNKAALEVAQDLDFWDRVNYKKKHKYLASKGITLADPSLKGVGRGALLGPFAADDYVFTPEAAKKYLKPEKK